KHRPACHRPGTQAAIEINRRLIPVEHAPLHAPVITLARNAGQVQQQGLANTLAAFGLAHVDVFKIKPGAPDKSGKVAEEKRKAGSLTIPLRNDRLGYRAVAEQ